MTITITVEYEGAKPKYDLAVREKLTIEAIRQSKFDLVCYTIHKLVDMINKSRIEEQHAGHPGAHT